MTFEEWCKKEDVAATSLEQYFSWKAWNAAYEQGLLYNQDKEIPLDESFVEDLAREAFEEAASFGFSVDSFERLAYRIAKLAAKPAYKGLSREPTAWMIFNGEGGYEYCDDYKDMINWKKSYEKHGWPADWITPLYELWED